MEKYIDREKLIQRREVSYLLNNVRKGIIDLVKRQPAIDAVEVQCGEWVCYKKKRTCLKHFYMNIALFVVEKQPDVNYCPNCGAKMSRGE